MWRLSLFLLIIGCVAIPREEQIREFCLDPNNQCVEAVREGETLRAKDYETTGTKEEYDRYVDALLKDYGDKYPWKFKELKIEPGFLEFPPYPQPDRPEVADTPEPDPPEQPEPDPPEQPEPDPPDGCRSDHGKGDHSAGKGQGHDRGRGHSDRGHGKGK